MKNCSNCSAPLRSYSGRCEFCGAKVEGEADNDVTVAFIKSIDEELRGLMTPITYVSFIFLVAVFPLSSYFLTRFLGGKAIAGFIVAVFLCAVGFLLFGGVIGMESNKFFAKQTLPQVRDFQKKYQIESEEFIETAKAVLTKDNGLSQYLHRLV
jgi:hypothetical protein